MGLGFITFNKHEKCHCLDKYSIKDFYASKNSVFIEQLIKILIYD